MTDVNVAFATEKQGQIAAARELVDRRTADIARYDSGELQRELDARFEAQIAEGKIERVSADTYRVLEGWDRNEIFRMQRATRPSEIPLILPEHGLDEIDGKAQLYTAVPGWHDVGNVIPGGTTDIGEVLREGGISWLVMQKPATFDWMGETHEVPGQFVNVRSDNGFPLGVVGKIYTPAQPREQLAFLQDLAQSYDTPFETAGPLNGGKQVFVSMKVPNAIRVDVDGLNETIELFLVVFNSNDGNGKLRCVATPWRPLCGNTNRFALRDAVTSWGTRHTKSWKDRAEEARRQLQLVDAYGNEFAKEETQLAQSAMTLAEVEKLCGEIWGELDEDATTRNRLAHERRLDKVFERFGLESARVGPTAYAAENAITGYLDHDKNRNAGNAVNMAAARATANLLGADDKIKNATHEKLMLRLAA